MAGGAGEGRFCGADCVAARGARARVLQGLYAQGGRGSAERATGHGEGAAAGRIDQVARHVGGGTVNEVAGDWVHALMGPYVVGALTPAERSEFEAHLAVCEECAAEAASLETAVATLADAEAASPPASLRARVMLEASKTPQVTPGVTQVDEVGARRSRRWLPRAALAAASVLVLAA